jgi:uncharacterized membrane protein
MWKRALRWLLAGFMTLAGLNHFLSPGVYVAMMPAVLPAPLALVYISGIAEMAGGIGLMLRRTRKLDAWGLIALFIAVFPANINMALNSLPLGESTVPQWALWARLPLQLVMIAWAYLFTRDDGDVAAAR